MSKRRMMIAVLLATAGTLAFGQGTSEFPRKPIKLIAPFASGGTSDVLARVIAKELSAGLGQPVIVENQAGAGGTIGLGTVARAAPDGYTIGMGGVGSLVHTAGVYANTIKFDVKKDLAPIGLLGTAPVVVAVSPALGVSDLKGLVALARQKDGKLAYGSAGVGGALHLAAEMLQREAGVKMQHVPYRGGSPALTDLLGGQIQVAFLDVTTLLPYKDGAQLKLIGAASRQRVPQMPNVPTFVEQGFKNTVVEVWLGLVAPTGTPADIQQRLANVIQEAVAKPSFAMTLDKLGMRAMPSGRDAMARLIDEELAYWLPLIKDANITAE